MKSQLPNHKSQITRGYTLIEVVAATISGTMLLAGLAASMYIASQTAYTPLTAKKTNDANSIVLQIADELRHALYIVSEGPTHIELVVPDQTNDTTEDSIRYEWDGAAGGDLTRSYNHATPVVIATDVHDFRLTYTQQTRSESVRTTVESAEQKLFSYENLAGASALEVNSTTSLGQHLDPTPIFSLASPNEVVRWKINKVYFHGRRAGAADGRLFLRICKATSSAPVPTSDILSEMVINESSLASTETWHTLTYSNPIDDLSPYADYALTFEWESGGPTAEIGHAPSAGAGRLHSDNAGATWTHHPTSTHLYQIHGTYITVGTPVAFSRDVVTQVGLTFQIGPLALGRVETTVALANEPELLDAYWHTDFDVDPTLQDINGDGTLDWTVRGGGTFFVPSLSGGVWNADATLDSQPLHDFDKITIVDVGMRNTTVGGDGAVCWINADWSGGTHAPILVYLQRQSDGTQTLTLNGKTDDATVVPLKTISGLPDRMIDVRMTILPVDDRVNLHVDGIDYGSFGYYTYAPSSTDKYASVTESGSDAEFDYFTVRVSR